MAYVLHVVTPMHWIGEQMAALAQPTVSQGSRQWHITVDRGLEPVNDLDADDALWIAPGLLIALNDWRIASGMQAIELASPPAEWITRLPERLLGRTVVLSTAAQVRSWSDMPSELGTKPWSRIANGRVDEFPAARRDLASLHRALSDAPADSRIELDAHIPNIAEEWSILISQGAVAGSSPYCVHQPSGSRTIITVFDIDDIHEPAQHTSSPATFDESHRALAVEAARQAAVAAHISDASVLIAFREDCDQPVILEIDPVWCSTPYPYRAQPASPPTHGVSHPSVPEHPQDSQLTSGLGLFADCVIAAQRRTTQRIIPDGLRDATDLSRHESRATNEADARPNCSPRDLCSPHDWCCPAPYSPDPWMVQRYRHRYASCLPSATKP